MQIIKKLKILIFRVNFFNQLINSDFWKKIRNYNIILFFEYNLMVKISIFFKRKYLRNLIGDILVGKNISEPNPDPQPEPNPNPKPL